MGVRIPVGWGVGAAVLALAGWGPGLPRLAAQENEAPLRPVEEFWDYEPAWSPDGERLAFCSSRGSHPVLRIWVMDADGSNPVRLTDADTGRGDCFPAWSPDGSRIAFTSDRDGDREVYVVSSDGGGPTPLTRNEADDGHFVSWSPDGSTLAFQSDRSGDPEVYLMDADGGNVRRVTHRPGYDGTPDFSPDGRRLAFVTNRGRGGQIWVMDVDGTDAHAVTDLHGNQGDPEWSPQGDRILFYSNVDDPQYELYSVRPDGSELTRLTRSPNWDLDARISPDGRRMAWHSSRNGRYGIEVSDAWGSGRRRISNADAGDFVRSVAAEGIEATLAAYRAARAATPDARFVLGDEIVALVHEAATDGRPDDALVLAEFGFDLVRDSTEAFELLATALGAAGRPAPPTRSEFHTLLRERRYAEARQGIERGIALRGRWWVWTAGMLHRLGYDLLGRGDAEGATNVLALATLSFPEDPNAWDSLGEAEQAAGRDGEARLHFERACTLGRASGHPATPTFCARLGGGGGG